MAEVRWTPDALEDLDAICLFIARDSPTHAAAFAHRAFQATDRLAKAPSLGRMVPELGRKEIREIILGNYRIVYTLSGNYVQIVTVHHGARLLRPEETE
jgi:plasmid stabilization system protein ParE